MYTKKPSLLSCGISLIAVLALSASSAFADVSTSQGADFATVETCAVPQIEPGTTAQTVAAVEVSQEVGPVASFEAGTEAVTIAGTSQGVMSSTDLVIAYSTVTAPQEAMGVTQMEGIEIADSPQIGDSVIAFDSTTASGIVTTSANAGFDTSQEGTVSSFVTSAASSVQLAIAA